MICRRNLGLLCLLIAPVAAQDFRWEAGAHFSRLDLDSLGESAGGFGGGVSYYLKPSIAVDVEATYFLKNSSQNFGHTQVLAGARAGYWFGPLGLFAKARPGVLHLGGVAGRLNPDRQDQFVLDVGGVVLLGRGRIGMRIDAGDTIAFWGSRPFVVGVPLPATRHNRQVNIGFVVRF